MDKFGAHCAAFANGAKALDVLKNPRNELKLRKEALERLLQDEDTPDTETCEVLQDLIRFESKLRYGAFKKLVEILPNGYIEERFWINLKSIVKYMADSDVKIEDMEVLMKKDKSGSLAPIIAMAVYRICTRREDLDVGVAILREIFNIKEYRYVLDYEQIFMLFNVAAQSPEVVHKKNLMTIMERNVCDHDKSSYGRLFRDIHASMSTNYVDKDHAKEIREIVKVGIRLIDGKIVHLINLLKHDLFGEELLELLVTVQNKQGFGENIKKEFFKRLTVVPALLKYQATYKILMNFLKSGYTVPEKILQMTFEHVYEDSLTHGVFQLVKYSNHVDKLIDSAKHILFDSEKMPIQRKAAAEYLLKAIEVSSIQPDKNFYQLALEKVNKWEGFELCSLAFKCFVKLEPKVSERFVVAFYENLKEIILSNEVDNIEQEDLSRLDDYILDTLYSTNDKVCLINTLVDVYSIINKRLSRIQNKDILNNMKMINVDAFEKNHPSLWRQELLCGALIFGTTLEECTMEENYEFYLEAFMCCVKNLKMSVPDGCTLEEVLSKLVTKQSMLRLNIKQTIEFLVILKSQSIVETFFERPPEFTIDFSSMKKQWLSEFLKKRDIEIEESDNYLIDLLLAFNIVLVENMLNYVSGRIDFDNLLEIIKILHDCDANFETKENFLHQRVAENTRFLDWKMKLCFFAVENALEINTKNAYNQAQNMYKYKFEDVKVIGSQLIEKYPYKLVFVSEIKYLRTAISSSKDDKDVFFLGKISDDHWVVIVIMKRGEEILALYKDSFGESFETERKEIENIIKQEYSNIEFIVHQNQEQYDEFSGAVFALRNLKIMAKKMTINRKEFVEGFKSMSFASEAAVDVMRKKEFPKLYAKGCSVNYQRYGNIEVPSLRNAYNQAKLPYKYNLEDVTTIASQLMKYYTEDLKLIIILRLQDLGHAFETFDEEKQDRMILIKVSSDHWVTLAVLKLNDEDIVVLYKDSLGTEEFKFERNQAEVVLKKRFLRLKMIYHKTQDQLDDFSGAVFALSNLMIIAEKMAENRENFIENFEKELFCSQTLANKNRFLNFPKHYAVSFCEQYKKGDVMKHHEVELSTLKDILKSKLKIDTITIDGEKCSKPNLVISMVFPHSKRVSSQKERRLFLIVHITEILKRLNVQPNEFTKKQIMEYFKQSAGYKIFKSSSNLFDFPKKDDEVDSMIEGKLMSRMSNDVKKLFKLGWTFESVTELVGSVDTEEYLKVLQECVVIIWEYQLREYDSDASGRRLFDILRDRTVRDAERRVHDLAIHKTFWGSHHKSIEELENEILHLNKDGNITEQQCRRALDAYNNILKCFNEKSSLFPYHENISNWEETLIGQWSKEVNIENMCVSQYEKLAVITRAVEVAHGLKPRDIQMLSLIFLINGQEDRGRVAEINTGEGKTVIIAMIAALQALDGHKVDVITSSPELSLPQAEEQQKFYDLLNLKSAAFSKSNDKNENILYGYVNEFQAESLQNDIFSNNLLRASKVIRRPYDIAIVDEVDSMLIDDRYHILKLSVPVPGMGSLQSCLAAVWLQVGLVSSSIMEKDGQAYYLESEGTVNEEGQAVASLEKIAVPINCTKSKFITDCTEVHLRKVLRDVSHLPEDDKAIEKGYPEIIIPKHLRDLVTEVQIPKWIESCITAKFWLELNKHYIIRNNDKIVPVDTYNTGVVQESMYWSNGLHQFLQIKHGAKLTSESLTSNYVSNVSFFKQYGKSLYGLTGTVGNERTKELLTNTYGVDDISIPPFKQKQYRELTPIVVVDKKAWLNLIVKNSTQKLRNGRAILIIVQYIADTEELAEMFKKSGCDNRDVKVYKTNEDSSAVRETLESNQVIITTNISGRGTDVKVSQEVERNGGLHVCLTFVPLNSRVQKQNFGRTSRMGNRGTGQFILYDEKGRSLGTLLAERDKEYERSLRQAENEIKRVLVKDIVFDRFCNLLLQLELNGLNNTETEAVKERFGIWLKVGESVYDYEHEERVIEEFEIFKSKLISDQHTGGLIKNPFYLLRDGIKKLENKDFAGALSDFDGAIAKDSHFTENAFYGRACAKVAKYGGSLSKHYDIINGAVRDYKKARSLFEERERELQFIQRCSESTVFSEQIVHKINLINIQTRAIDCAIGVDVDKLKGQIESLETMKNTRKDLTDDDKKNISENIKNLQEQIESNGDGGVLGKALNNRNKVEITFVDINESLPSEDIALYKEELNEFKINGFIGEFTIKEIKPIPWFRVFALLLIGLVQIVVGAAMVRFSVGAASSFGVGLILEGVGDIITAVKDGIINRDFSWESWGIQKAISFTVSLVCAGMQAIKNFVKSVYYGVKGAMSSAVSGITQSVKEGWKLAAKKVGIELAKGVAKELVNGLVDYGVDNLLIPKIQEKIAEIVEVPIQNALLNNKMVQKMLKLDEKNRNKYFENAIESMASKILDPERDHAVFTLLKGISLGIAGNKIKGLSTVVQITEALQALNEIGNFIPEFINRLNAEINKLAIEKGLLKEKNKEKTDEAKNIENNQVSTNNNVEGEIINKEIDKQSDESEEETEVEVIDDNVQVTSVLIDAPSNLGRDDLDLYKSEDLQQVAFGTNKKESKTLGVFLSKKVSANISGIIKGKLITPATRAAVNYGVDKLSSNVEKTVDKQIENYRAERRITFSQTGIEGDRFDDSYHDKHKDPKSRETAANIIADVAENGEVGLIHLGAISDTVERPIQVMDSKGRLKYTIGKDKGGAPLKVQYFEPSNSNPQGHWTLPGGKEPVNFTGGTNDCLFNVIAEQTDTSPTDLRQNTVKSMKRNFYRLANQAADFNTLQSYKKTALCFGGAIFQGTTVDDAGKVLDNSQGVKGHKYAAPGHPRGHASDSTLPSKPKNIDCVENYSYTGLKSGFISKDDQNTFAFHALSSKEAQLAMDKLNKGSTREVVTVPVASLNMPNVTDARQWNRGNVVYKPFRPTSVTTVLQHHVGQQNNPSAPVHVHTIYPRK